MSEWNDAGCYDEADRESRYAEAIWNASRNDEGTISAAGAHIVARALMRMIDADLAAAEYAAERSLDNCIEWMTRAEAAEARVRRVEAVLADEWYDEPPSSTYPDGRRLYRWPMNLRADLLAALDGADA